MLGALPGSRLTSSPFRAGGDIISSSRQVTVSPHYGIQSTRHSKYMKCDVKSNSSLVLTICLHESNAVARTTWIRMCVEGDELHSCKSHGCARASGGGVLRGASRCSSCKGRGNGDGRIVRDDFFEEIVQLNLCYYDMIHLLFWRMLV